MIRYSAPVEDFSFILNEVLGLHNHLKEIGATEQMSAEDVLVIASEAGKLTQQIILPINRVSDEEGCEFDQGRVTVPYGIKKAYQAYVEGGWSGLTCAMEDGGQELPHVVGLVVQEIINSGSISFGDYVGLFNFAYRLLRAHGSAQQKSDYLSGLAQGSLGATMCMTEPHCGTDIGLLRTKAEPRSDGSFAISGTKIFISAGDQDLTENIIHLVLARIPGAPPGTRGASLFLVPKFLPGLDGGLGERNAVVAAGLEHKMGYSASATCQMSFDEAKGWLVGECNRGLMAMFTMINAARLAVAGQGLSTAATAYQTAAAYAKERVQGRSLTGAQFPELAADPIIVHPDVRRMLLSSRAFVEGARAIYLWMGMQLDLAERHPDPTKRDEAEAWLALMTPVVKSTLSDLGFQACNDCMQIFGGHGYIRDTGVEQLVRDARIAQIQEGANGMLALDLIKRQVLRDGGPAYELFLQTLRRFLAENKGCAEASIALRGLQYAVDRLEAATAWVRVRGRDDPNELGAAGVDYQRIFGLTILAWMWTKMAIAAASHPQSHTAFYSDKLLTANFFAERILPMIEGHFAVMKAGGATVMQPTTDYF
jgi:alkylation response protein AidB-like acyl-CoA dehydrogenase